MKKLLIPLALCLPLLLCGAAEVYDEYTVTLSAATWTNMDVRHGEHVQFSTALTDVYVRIKYNIYGSGGAVVGSGYFPETPDAVTTYPATADTTFLLHDTSLTPWDTFNNTPVDYIRLISATGGDVKIRVKR